MPKKPKPPSYTKAPTLERTHLELYTTVLKVLSNQLTVSEAARELGMPRNRFQTWMHRAQEGMISGLTPRKPGRPESPPPDKELVQQYRQLEERNQQLQSELAKQSELMLAAGQVIREQMGRTPRRGRSRARRPPGASSNDDEGAPARALAHVVATRGVGLSRSWLARWIGCSESTLRRWQHRSGRGQPAIIRRGAPQRLPLRSRSSERAAQIEALVRETRGVFGADALRRAIVGVSRREAAGIKREVCTQVERERKAAAARVVVTVPGLMRGFDAMHTASKLGRSYALCSGDAAVPYTTSILVTARYDGPSVRLALERDFQDNGVPLVMRLDRFSAHGCPRVQSLFSALGVLVLQGPAHYPCFYGQLERQNRERRGWLRALGCPTHDELVSELERSRVLLNSSLARRSLGWCTAEARWCQRPTLTVDRAAFREEVAERDARYRARLAPQSPGVDADLAYRLAVINTLKHHGWLSLESRGARYGVSD